MDKKNNYLFINHTSLIGGASKSGTFILEALNKNGIKPNIIYRSGENGSFVKFMEERGIRYNKLIDFKHFPHPLYHFNGNYHKVYSLKFLKSLFFILLSIWPLISSIRRLKPRVVIINSLTVSWIAILIKIINTNIKVVCWVRETIPNEGKGFRNFIIKNILKYFSDKIIFISKFDLKQYPIAPHKLKLIYNPERDYENSILDQGQKKFTFLFLGGINELKGTELFLKAFLFCLRNSDVKSRIILAGLSIYKPSQKYSKYELRCLDLISKINIEFPSCIEMIETISDINRLYREASIVIFCPNEIHQSRLIFESAINYKPIIVPNKKNIEEHLFKNVVLTYEENNFKSLASVMTKLVNRELEIDEISLLEHKEFTLSKHSFGVFQKKINQLIQEVEN